jgi:hypothetical protein
MLDIDELIERFERTDGVGMTELELRNLIAYYRKLAGVKDRWKGDK